MPARALIVLLLILNLGVALWWTMRDAPAAVDEVALPPGAEPLQLLEEPARSAAPPAAPEAATGDDTQASAWAAAPADAVCHSLGPFADRAAAARAQAQLRPAVARTALREAPATPRGWSVQLPALADREAADAAIARLTDAGFRDHYIMPAAADGSMDIALGRFGSQDAAQRHRTALREAGFETVATPIGDGGGVRYWVDVATDGQGDIVALRRLSGAAQAERIDCGASAALG